MNKTLLNILEIGCSGLIGVLITIGYQHFFSQPQNQQLGQIQEQNQQQEQVQNQSINVNIKGQEISYQSDDVIYLNNRISELEKKVSKLLPCRNPAQTIMKTFLHRLLLGFLFP